MAAVKIAVCEVATALMLAVKLTLAAPAGTVTDAGTLTAPLLLVRATPIPPLGAGPLNVTVQASVPDPVMDALLQIRELNKGVAAPTCRAKLLETAPAEAVRVTAWLVLTCDTLAVNAALVALAGTVTDEGTETATLLLDRLTTSPPLGATPLRETVHASVPDPVTEALLHDSALNVETVLLAASPFPCSFTFVAR